MVESRGQEMKKSILQSSKYCWVCRALYPLHYHHIYGGRNRRVSDENGFGVYLCFDHHVGEHGVHNNPRADMALKKTCQMVYERDHGTREDFLKLIGKNYLTGEERTEE